MKRALVTLAAVVAACSGCAAPVAHPAPGQAAVLDPALVSDDRPGFRTDQAVRVDIDAVCQQLQSLTPPTNGGCYGQTRSGSNVTFRLDPRGFDPFWNGRLAEFYYGVSHSRRQVLLDRFWAVELVDPATRGACTVAVDLGAPEAMTLAVSGRGADTLSAEQSQALCDEGFETLTPVLESMDPGGGSNVG